MCEVILNVDFLLCKKEYGIFFSSYTMYTDTHTVIETGIV